MVRVLTMSEDEYYAAIRAIGLMPTRFPETWVTVNNEPYSVPLAASLTPGARVETITRLKAMLSPTA